MRLHQSWWRARVLGVACGTGPTESSANRYGNMLGRAAGAVGRNFLSPESFAVAKARLAEGGGAIEPFRLLHNTLSSQPMCFNLFGMLVGNEARATRLVRAWLGDEVARVRRVAIEWAPEPASAYLDDRTAFDAMIEYERADGALVLVGIETKLTDSFSQKLYDPPIYREWMGGARSPWRDDAHPPVATPRFNQVWRNHLLAIAARDRAGSSWEDARSVVVHHPLDRAAAGVLAGYRALLREGDTTFLSATLDQVVDAFAAAVTDDERAWLDAFRVRYLELERSAGAQ